MQLVRSRNLTTTHKVAEIQGDRALTGCGLTLVYASHTRLDHLYPTCQRCARKC